MTSEMASFTTPWLTFAIFVPIVCGLLILAVGSDERPALTRNLSLISALLSFFVTIPLYTGFDNTTAAMQFVVEKPWIPAFAVMYHLGVDGISLWFVLLTAFITIIVVLAGWEVITSRIAQYMAAFLILSGLMIGVFVALDGVEGKPTAVPAWRPEDPDDRRLAEYALKVMALSKDIEQAVASLRQG